MGIVSRTGDCPDPPSPPHPPSVNMRGVPSTGPESCEMESEAYTEVVPDQETNGAPLDRPHFEVLNSIVLKKMASAGSVSSATGLPLGEVEGMMSELEQAGLIVLVGEQALAGDSAQDRVAEFADGWYADLRGDE